MEPQRNESENSKEYEQFVKEEAEKGNVVHKPKVVQDGTCEHYFVDEGIDSDGHGNASCSKCWIGRFYDPDNYEVTNGTITAV